jgi:hypothetical protein
MSGWREEVKVFPCGCKVGRSANGMWFYDFICDEHIKEVRTDGHYDYDKAVKFTEEMNKRMKEEEKNE